MALKSSLRCSAWAVTAIARRYSSMYDFKVALVDQGWEVAIAGMLHAPVRRPDAGHAIAEKTCGIVGFYAVSWGTSSVERSFDSIVTGQERNAWETSVVDLQHAEVLAVATQEPPG